MEGYKTEGVYASLGLPFQLVLERKSMRAADLVHAAEDVVKSRDALSRHLAEQLSQFRDRLATLPQMWRALCG
jgi:hypothetical protein